MSGRILELDTTGHDWCDLAIRVYAALVEDRVHFAQAAYRDGEWACILGRTGRTCNDEAFDPVLGERLRRTLLSPVGQWCLFWWPHPKIGQAAHKGALRWLAEHRPNVRWIPDRPISRANESGKAAPFWAACRTRRVVLVGPQHMNRLTMFDVAAHIEVPAKVAWKHADRVVREVLAVHEPDDLVFFAAGMGSNLMIHELWPTLRGKATLIDVGAALDPYCGEFSRGVFRAQSWKDRIMPRNIP